MEFGIAEAFRFLNMAICAFVLVLCVMKLTWKDPDRGRRFRILGIGLVAIYVASASHQLLHNAFHPRIIFASLGLLSCAYGLKIMCVADQVNAKHNRA